MSDPLEALAAFHAGIPLQDRFAALAGASAYRNLPDGWVVGAADIVGFPTAVIKVVSDYDVLPQHPELQAAIWTKAQARAWAAPRKQYSAVVPKDVGGQMLIAYLMPPDANQFTHFINYWLRVQNASGFTARMERRWIEGKNETVRHRRNHVAEWLRHEEPR